MLHSTLYHVTENSFITLTCVIPVFLAAGLCLDAGHVSLTFDLGTGPTHVRSPEILVLNVDHVVVVTFQGLKGFLQVDGAEPLQNTAPGTIALPLLPAPVYYGGVPRTLVVPGTVPVATGE